MLTILQGDAIEQLRTLPDESVQCCVTSPPYWGLRDYGTSAWEGGDADCDHREAASGATLNKGNNDMGHPYRGDCGKCGARRIDSQLGLEKTPEEYVAKMVAVFREVRRVLRKDGTLWLNLGDSYAGGGNYRGVNEETLSDKQRSNRASHGLNQRCGIIDIPSGLKPKDLCGIPWRVAFALQSDGWWLRSDIIWAKPNPMPESVTDRPTKSHEYLFLLTKSANYFYDAEAIKEKAEYGRREWSDTKGNMAGIGINGTRGHATVSGGDPDAGRNKRSVWTVATAPYPEAHFATYPPDLIKPCIMAGTSAKGCCAKCGAPWERIVERGETTMRSENDGKGYVASVSQDMQGMRKGILPNASTEIKTVGWQPTCRCRLPYTVFGGGPQSTVPCTVLDPFAGSGTTGAVALELGRKAVLIELNPAYAKLIEQRCNVTMGLALA